MATYTILNRRIKEKDLPNFTRQLYKNRQKDRRIKMEKEKKFEVSKEKFDTYVKDNNYYLAFKDGYDVIQSVKYNFYFKDDDSKIDIFENQEVIKNLLITINESINGLLGESSNKIKIVQKPELAIKIKEKILEQDIELPQ